MAEAKQILVVDDHFEMLEFLRSMLEVSGQDYEVLAVPSAEEGLLELRRAHFDLLISDVRLPGMSGFELLRRLKKLGRELPAIMITAYTSPQGEKEAEELGVFRYFKKPLDTDSMLTAVHLALFGEVPESTAVVVDDSVRIDVEITDDVRRRLDVLRSDTGATNLMLTAKSGNILLNVGDNQSLDLDRLALILTRTITDSFLLADELKAKKPFTLQYHTGGHTELYCANIGSDYYLTIFFDARSRRGRIGTIWVFTQRAIKDLVDMLPDLSQGGVAVSPSLPPLPAKRTQSEQSAPISPTRIKGDRKKREPIPRRQPVKQEEETAVPDWALEVPDDPEPEETTITPDYIDIDPDELGELLASGSGGDEDSLDSFWDDAMDVSDENEAATKGLSFEDAMKQGLISLDDNE